jgi:hypothetical protein
MSLVGPRPKLPKHQAVYFQCRPGLTGGATIVFAREEVTLSNVPSCHLEHYYHSVVLPAKQRLDDDYMTRATFASDLRLILKSVFRHWDDVALTDITSLEPHLQRFMAQPRMTDDLPFAESVTCLGKKSPLRVVTEGTDFGRANVIPN